MSAKIFVLIALAVFVAATVWHSMTHGSVQMVSIGSKSDLLPVPVITRHEDLIQAF
jgi:predicted membrane channel-forming protein YqfA (hemolysin III family)